MVRGKGIGMGGLFMVVIMSILFLYLGAKFVGEDAEGKIILEKPSSEELSELPLQAFKVLLLGAAIFGAYALISKATGAPMSKKDAFSLILIGIGLYILWDKVLADLVGELGDISFTVAKKIGFMK